MVSDENTQDPRLSVFYLTWERKEKERKSLFLPCLEQKQEVPVEWFQASVPHCLSGLNRLAWWLSSWCLTYYEVAGKTVVEISQWPMTGSHGCMEDSVCWGWWGLASSFYLSAVRSTAHWPVMAWLCKKSDYFQLQKIGCWKSVCSKCISPSIPQPQWGATTDLKTCATI